MGRGEGDVCGDREMVRRGGEAGRRADGAIDCLGVLAAAAALRPGLLRGVRHVQRLLHRFQGSQIS